MKKKLILGGFILAAIVALIVTGLGGGLIKAPGPTPVPASPTPIPTLTTATPVTTPTIVPAPTPSAPVPLAMTAEDFYEKLHKNPDDFINGAEVIITGTVASKSGDYVRFVVPWVDLARGELKFEISLELSQNELARVKIGETITVKGKMGGYMLHQWAYISNSKIRMGVP